MIKYKNLVGLYQSVIVQMEEVIILLTVLFVDVIELHHYYICMYPGVSLC